MKDKPVWSERGCSKGSLFLYVCAVYELYGAFYFFIKESLFFMKEPWIFLNTLYPASVKQKKFQIYLEF